MLYGDTPVTTRRLTMRCYSELIQYSDIHDRYDYLKFAQSVGEPTFRSYRYLNQSLYQSKEWKDFRYKIIVRDGGNDLAVDGYPVIKGVVHHINPLTIEQVLNGDDCIFDPENVILCSFDTHNAIHYGASHLMQRELIVRRPNDTCPWK